MQALRCTSAKMKHRFKINCNAVLFLLRRLMAGETPAVGGNQWPMSPPLGRRGLHARAGEDPLESAVADRAVPAALLHRRLSRPGERRHRQPDDERRPRSLAVRIRLECRAVLLRLFPGGSAEQSGLAGDRRPQVDRPHPDHLGPDLGRDGVRGRPGEFRRDALPARPRRGRLHARRVPLLHLLVPGTRPRQGDSGIPARHPDREHHRRADLEFTARLRRPGRPARLAVAADP